ncbi:MAG TPA: ABC transporter ATP-binding protein [Pyrinomonadaceae bacterium]|nr:ABC transporter ATP-binding protein [Pyrinomonadaceae bacterium]
MKPIIKVENISKQYRLGASRQSYGTLRDALAGAFRAPLRRRGGRAAHETIWALKDVGFEIVPGEVVGIIGRNGAGKSTLLKILSRITEPTSGRAELYGRTASLLEVGTGFHPELTGRENMFLNAAILGMPRTEIERKFDEIVAFAEIEKFLDTPVKHYSSGMYVRLAFAVAAHLEPEILIVDEVLAVGDTAFQKKCLGKMHGVTQQGRTVLFVSHSMAAIKSLCGRAMLLDEGRITCEGDVNTVVDSYLMAGSEMAQTGIIPDKAPRFGTGEVRVRRVELLDLNGAPLSQVYFGQPFRVTLTLEVSEDVEDAVVALGISSLEGTRILSTYNTDGGRPPAKLTAGLIKIAVELEITLFPRNYALDVLICHQTGADIDVLSSVLRFEALGVAETGEDHYRWGTAHGYVRPDGRWLAAEVAEEDLTASDAAA